MISISLCMIVKNEEELLARCLDSVSPLMDEVIIVDTGSTDRTKEIAARYTDKIYNFAWCDDFSAARNYAFSKATMDYIYCPDADEYMDSENQRQFRLLRQVMLPEIEIVQMYYVTPTNYNTIQNCKKELRPKLFKRLREFTWIDPVHETVRTEPVVFDSDIEIQHLPHTPHYKRDFELFQKAFARDGFLSDKALMMYARELYKCGSDEDYLASREAFQWHYNKSGDQESASVLAHVSRLQNNMAEFLSTCVKDLAEDSCSEICYEIGLYYESLEEWNEASLWFYNAAFEASPILDLEVSEKKALLELAKCYRILADDQSIPAKKRTVLTKEANQYQKKADNWELPETL